MSKQTTQHSNTPYLASLEAGLARLRAPVPAQPLQAAPPSQADLSADALARMHAWIATVEQNAALYDSVPADPNILAEAVRPGRLAGRGTHMPDQIMIPFRGAAPFFVRCLAALAASGMDGVGLTLNDTGTPDDAMARLAAYCHALGFDLSVTRGTSPEAIDRKYTLAAWGSVPKRVIILNSDTVPTPGFAQRLYSSLDDHPEIKCISAASNARLDAFIHRDGFIEGPENTLLERVWRFHHALTTQRPGEVAPCPYASMTCAAFDWAAWHEVAPGATPFDYGHHYDLHIGCLLREAGHQLAVREDCAVYHMGHATYREQGESAVYDQVLARTLLYIERWGHLPEHYDLMHELLHTSTTSSH